MKKFVTAMTLVAGMGAAIVSTPTFAASGAMACMSGCNQAYAGCLSGGTNLAFPGKGQAADQTRANMSVSLSCAAEARACYKSCR